MKAKQVERIKTSLQIHEEIDLHEKGWVIQRIGWALLLTLIGCASVGVFGDGILSQQQLKKNSTIIDYERFGRYESAIELSVQAVAENGNVLISLPSQYLRECELEKIVPEPDEQLLQDGRYLYKYKLQGAHPIEVTFRLNPKTTGRTGTTLLVNDTPFTFSQFIYP